MTENVRRLVKAGIPVTGSVVVTTLNYRSIPSITKLCNELGIDNLQIAGLYPSGRGASLLDYIPTNKQLAVASQAYAKSVFTGKIAPALPSFYRFEEEYNKNPTTFNFLRDNPFMASVGIHSLRVNPIGECFTSIKFENTPYFSLGNLKRESLTDVWQSSSLLNKLRGFYFAAPANQYQALDLRVLPEFQQGVYATLATKWQ